MKQVRRLLPGALAALLLALALAACSASTDAATSIGTTSATFNGHGACGSSDSGTWTAWFEYRALGSTGAWTKTPSTSGTCSGSTTTISKSLNVTGLAPDTAYQYRVGASMSGRTAWSDSTGATNSDAAGNSGEPYTQVRTKKPPSPANVTFAQHCSLSKTAVTQGDTVTATGTLTNTGGTAITLSDVVLAGRPPGGTNAGGPFDDFAPRGGQQTIQPGASYTLTATRTFTSSDPTGSGWYCYLTYQTQDGAWHDDASTTAFTVAAPSTGGGSYAGPLFAANTFNTGVADGVPNNLFGVNVSSDGIAVSYSNWEEYSHDARLFTSTGKVVGPYTSSRDQGGIYGAAVDGTYVYTALGNGTVRRGSRSTWLDPANTGWSDEGSNTGVGPLTVDGGGAQLGQMVLCGGSLRVIDQGAIKTVPTSLSGVSGSFAVSNAKALACDRQGNLWVVQQPGNTAVRFSTSGQQLASFALPGYVDAIAADPASDAIWVADNSKDQNFKKLSYTGVQLGQLGVTGGYLADGGKVDGSHFAGPRGIAVDSAGEIFTAETGLPGQGDRVWTDNGNAALVTKFNVDGSVAWRDFGGAFVGDGQATSDMSSFFLRHWELKRDASGNYTIPYAYLADPWQNPGDDRLGNSGDNWSQSSYTWDAGGHRYLGVADVYGGSYDVFLQRPGSSVFDPVKQFTNAYDYWTDQSGNMWEAVEFTGVREYKLTGYDASGVPQYDAGTTFPLPPGITRIRRVEVHGSTIYVSGFSSSDPNPDNDWDGWKSMGRHLIRFDSLPTTGGWPTPAWKVDGIYTGSSSTEFGYTDGFTVSDTGIIAVTWLDDPANTSQPRLDFRSASTGALIKTLAPPLTDPRVGRPDIFRSVVANPGGWIAYEDDWGTRNVLFCAKQYLSPAGTCS